MLPRLVAPMLRQLEEPAERYTGGGLPKGWIMIVIGTALYVLPSLLAWKNESPRRTTITLINLLLGWTVIGWIVALVMTFGSIYNTVVNPRFGGARGSQMMF